ncbi:MAG: GNAT family N-acetyltransferase [Pseudomonadota bacterium]
MLIIEAADSDPRIQRLIALQKAHALEHTPPQYGHAFDAGSEKTAAVRFFLALQGDEPVGCVGLATLGPGEAEIKTMHVLAASRGEGIGMALLERVIDEARTTGATVLKLETGPNEGFAASRRLYERAGFKKCPPWGAYIDDPFSHCMARKIEVR